MKAHCNNNCVLYSIHVHVPELSGSSAARADLLASLGIII